MEKKTLVLGASLNPDRYSNMAINRLITTVTLYLNPKRQEEYYDYILSLKPQRVIFNPGTENPDLYKILRENNIENEVACTLVLLGTNQY